MAPASPPPAAIAPQELLLLASVLVVAACGLVYELAAGALASYLLGDSVLQFSTIIGAYLAAMGVGSWLSRYLERQLVAQFVRIELLVGLVGGLMPVALFTLHSLLPPAQAGAFRVLLYALVGVVGVLVGLEIPLVMRILQHQFRQRWALRELVSQVLTVDYLGALLVSVAFPLLLLPQLGLLRTGVAFGLLNALVAAWALWLFRAQIRPLRALAGACGATLAVLAGAFFTAEPLTRWTEQRFYGEPVVLSETSDYQRVVLTAGSHGVRLFLNGNLQFNSQDEYRYHEALVHPAMAAYAAQAAPRRVLVLGGGDGMAVREVLRYPGVQQVTLVELDPHISRLFRTDARLRALNGDALNAPRLRLVTADAYTWLDGHDEVFDVVIIDFPDPSNFSLGKLYTTSFYERVDRHLAAGGFAVVQTTSPLIARQSFWTVAATLEAVGLATTPYHAHVPSFGEWGFIIASHRPWQPPTGVAAAGAAPGPRQLPAGLRFITPDGLAALLQFPPDMARVPAQPNRLGNQVLVHTFEQEWGKVR